MSDQKKPGQPQPGQKKGGISRRRLLAGGVVAAPTLALLHETVPHQGIHAALGGGSASAQTHHAVGPAAKMAHGGGVEGPTFRQDATVDHVHNGFNPTEILRDFDYGTTTRLASGRVLREWELVATDKEIEVAPGINFPAWTYNGRIPGPTLRCREGDRLRIRFVNGSAHPHTIHFHGLHPAIMDGVPDVGAGLIEPGGSTVYEFDAEPFGLHLYHCHVGPLAEHIARGLYGTFIVDPKQGRPEADEMVMVQHGYNTTFDGEGNQLYAVNGIPFHYLDEPVAGAARRARADLPGEHARVRPDQFVPHPRELLRLLPDRYPAGADRVHRHRDPGPGPARDLRAALPQPRAVHVPRPQDRVRRARLDGLLRGRRLIVEARGQAIEPSGRLATVPTWALVGGALALIAAVLVALALVGGDSLPERLGPPVEELAVERTELTPGRIELSVRNTGPDAVQIAQVFVNDAYVDFEGAEQPIGRLGSADLSLDYPWLEGQPYLVSMVTSTGVVIEHEIAAAVETPSADGDLFGLMALLGTYVGIVPVILGMALLPAMRRFQAGWIRVLMAFTIGLLAFLAVDASLEALDLAGQSGGAFGGAELLFLGAGIAYLLLVGIDRFLTRRTQAAGAGAATGGRLALLIAIGIGLHNLGEGLAIGSAYAIGELALGAFLVVGFAIHNTTEGFAIVAPLTRERPSLGRLLGLGAIAGAPAILGALIGATISNDELSVFLLGVGVGAIVQVIVQITPAIRDRAGRALDTATAAAIALGAVVFYLTSLLVSI